MGILQTGYYKLQGRWNALDLILLSMFNKSVVAPQKKENEKEKILMTIELKPDPRL